MVRIFLIIITAIQLSGCAVFWQTAGGTLVGNLGAEVVKEELKETKDDDEKKQAHKP